MLRHWKAFLIAGLCLGITTPSRAADNIVETAVANGNFETLATALKAAGLAETLQGEGPFTVFAPTDDAFAKLPEGTVATLVKPENKDRLTSILTYHVVPGKVPASEVTKLSGAVTVNGQRVNIKVSDSGVTVDDATVVTTDIECSNGIIHVIDSVLMPADKSIPQVAQEAGSFGTLLAAVKAAGLAETLSGEGPFTVFAPTDDAFAKLPEGTVEDLLKPENKNKLVDILKYHVVSGRVYSGQVVSLDSADTLLGQSVAVKVTDSGVMIGQAGLVAADIDASNGVIHVIDSVLLPGSGQDSSPTQMIEQAISKGAKLYNSGQHAACVRVYADTMHKLMSTKAGEQYGDQIRQSLKAAQSGHTAGDQAWTLRRGLDAMYSQMVHAGQ